MLFVFFDKICLRIDRSAGSVIYTTDKRLAFSHYSNIFSERKMSGRMGVGQRVGSQRATQRNRVSSKHASCFLTYLSCVCSRREIPPNAKAAVAAALRTGTTSIVNTLNVVGLVTIPGMMTGQVLGGAAPTKAAAYQVRNSHSSL